MRLPGLPPAALAVLVAIASGACTSAGNGEPEPSDAATAAMTADTHITMERQPCYGSCPVYTVGIAADGRVTFAGERHVDHVGKASSQIDPAAVSALIRELRDAGFFSFADKYTYNEPACGAYHTDAPRAIVTVITSGRTKRVEHDFGCHDAPAGLRELQDRIDEVAGVAQWVGAR